MYQCTLISCGTVNILVPKFAHNPVDNEPRGCRETVLQSWRVDKCFQRILDCHKNKRWLHFHIGCVCRMCTSSVGSPGVGLAQWEWSGKFGRRSDQDVVW